MASRPMSSLVRDFLRHQAPIVLDGGMATELEARGAVLDHELWSARLLVDEPSLIREVHTSYVEAGAQIITTATYQLNMRDIKALGLSESLFQLAVELAEESIQMTQEVARQDVLVAGSLGPFGASFGDGSEYTGNYRGAGAHDLDKWHRPRVEALSKTTADVLAFETVPVVSEAAFLTSMMQELKGLPYWISFQLRDGNHLANGERLSDAVAAVKDASGLCAVGVNCISPELVEEAASVILQATDLPVLAYPNSGESYRDGAWTDCPSTQQIIELAPGWLKMGIAAIGGCCRVGPETIGKLKTLRP